MIILGYLGLIVIAAVVFYLLRRPKHDFRIDEINYRIDRLFESLTHLGKQVDELNSRFRVGRPDAGPVAKSKHVPGRPDTLPIFKKAVPGAGDGVKIAATESAHLRQRVRSGVRTLIEPEKTDDAPPPAADPVVGGDDVQNGWERVAREQSALFWRNFEERAGKRWMTWAGVLILFASAAFFVKYAFEQEWLTAGLRIVFEMIAGAALVTFGHRLMHRKMLALGQGLIGGGLALMYLALYAAFAFHGLIGQTEAFGLMSAAIAIGMTIAVRHDALPVAILAVLGGILTPLLVSTGQNSRDVLFTYLLILNAGVIGVSLFKKWRWLDLLAFGGTYFLYAGWHYRYYDPSQLSPAIAWTLAFYLVFQVLPFVYHLRSGTTITGERFVMAIVNALAAFVFARRMLYPEREQLLGVMTAFFSVANFTLAILTHRKIPGDVRGFLAFIGLSILFATVTVPLEFGVNKVSVIWAFEAIFLAHLGYRYRLPFVRLAAAFVSLVLALRFLTHHLPLHGADFVIFRNTDFLAALAVPFGLLGIGYVHRRNKGGQNGFDVAVKIFSANLGGLMFFLTIGVEIQEWLYRYARDFGIVYGPALTYSAGAIVWSIAAPVFLVCGLKLSSFAGRVTGMAIYFVVGLLLLNAYFSRTGSGMEYFLNLRFYAALTACCSLALFSTFLSRNAQVVTAHELRLFPYGVIVAAVTLLFVLQIEARGLLIRKFSAEPGRDVSVEISGLGVAVWGIGALGLLAISTLIANTAARIVSLVMLFAMSVYCLNMYSGGRSCGGEYFLNARFIASLAALAIMLAHALLLPRHSWKGGVFGNIGGFEIVLVCVMGLIVLQVDSFGWIESRLAARFGGRAGYYCDCAGAVIWAIGALLLSRVGARLNNGLALILASFALVATGRYVGSMYFNRTVSENVLFWNMRFLTGMLGLYAGWIFGGTILRHSKTREAVEAATFVAYATAVRVLSWAGLFFLLTAEVRLFFVKLYADPDRAGWVSQMAVTITWGLYATLLLTLGFIFSKRVMRLAALLVFALAAGKLVILDMSHVREIYRIISGTALGVLMIAASYAYHRIERRVFGADGDDPGS